ncbi:MBL fold metallo-hydrolase [Thiomicrospira sp. ALE5]|uniref:MBL fold metallo-hydrolase n=1 Tax=Thiomicrospira sp. ALE5 TaxID=748650 RepID=UPI0008F1098F|nr:MBL fold metallo-hydrolase [Thiomicrospira sp. ALE5]SFR59997.1 Glyoxylase, beta-lactamase superfamily II [Thiomicrospira sp. ALE5]
MKTNMKRRDLFKSAMGIGAGLASFSVLKPLYAGDNWEVRGPDVPDVPITKVNERCYYFLAVDPEPSPANYGFFSNPGFVVTSEGVLVVDTGGSVQIGEMLIRQIKTVTDKPVTKIINTHIHGDHWLGNHAFVDAYPDVEIYSHPNVINQVKAGAGAVWTGFMSRNTNDATAGTVVTPPTKTLEGSETIQMGDTTIKIHFMGHVHTDSDLAVEVVEEKTLFIGDMAMRRVANISDGTFLGTIEAMKQMEAMDIDVFIPGHGDHEGKDLPRLQREFFEVIYSEIEKYYDEGLSDFEIRPKLDEHPFMVNEAKNWPGYDTTFGRFVSEAYQEFEANLF